jgi:hypothetical protein
MGEETDKIIVGAVLHPERNKKQHNFMDKK